jgi:hypothetical protein
VSAELVLSYRNGRWSARGEGLTAEHSELEGLERELAALLAARGATRAHLRFDLDGLPRWLRQYHAHYCNYVLHVLPRGGR